MERVRGGGLTGRVGLIEVGCGITLQVPLHQTHADSAKLEHSGTSQVSSMDISAGSLGTAESLYRNHRVQTLPGRNVLVWFRYVAYCCSIDDWNKNWPFNEFSSSDEFDQYFFDLQGAACVHSVQQDRIPLFKVA